jgi:hypothetical protein
VSEETDSEPNCENQKDIPTHFFLAFSLLFLDLFYGATGEELLTASSCRLN